jgi:spore germination cell wall hydrolase CwlJ-like protein
VADPTGGALYYHANTIARPSWVLKSPGAHATPIGNHIFYTGIA